VRQQRRQRNWSRRLAVVETSSSRRSISKFVRSSLLVLSSQVRGQEPENESRKLFCCCCDVERCFTSTSLEKTQIGFVTQSFFWRQTGRALSKLACLLASLLVLGSVGH
jgi:hypothetical protein